MLAYCALAEVERQPMRIPAVVIANVVMPLCMSFSYWMAALAGPSPTDWSSRDEHACRVARDAASDLWPRFLIVLIRADPPIGRSTAASSAIQPNAGAGKPALSAPQDMRSSVCEGRRLAGEVATPNQFQEARPLSRHLQMVRISSAQY